MKNNTALISGIKKGSLNAISFEMKIKGMRKFQEFIIYPISKGDKRIVIQSDTRIGKIDLNGNGQMSKSHQSGAGFAHFNLDNLTDFKIDNSDWRQIVEYIGLTESNCNQESPIQYDNSGAKSIFGLD